MTNGFIKVCAATPDLKVANTTFNVNECVKLAEAANEEGVKLIVFPKLSITGATCGDLFYSEKLIADAKAAGIVWKEGNPNVLPESDLSLSPYYWKYGK